MSCLDLDQVSMKTNAALAHTKMFAGVISVCKDEAMSTHLYTESNF
jgi:hypothetical protein